MEAPGEEEEDLEAIQAHLDMTMALTYEAVEASFENSTLPDDMVYETIDTFKPRPPRLGVGATRRDTTANGINSTTMARETARLHGRITGKKRGRDETDGDINASTTPNGLKRMHLQNDDSEDEESRTATIASKVKGKGKALDKFAVRNKHKPKGGKIGESLASVNGNSTVPTTSSPTKTNPFSTRPSHEDTRFIAPAPPRRFSVSSTKSSTVGPPPTTSSTSGGIYTPTQSPPPRMSPAISRSFSRSSTASRNSRHSNLSLSRRMVLKHQANSLWRIVSVERVSSSPAPPSPLLFNPVEHTETPTKRAAPKQTPMATSEGPSKVPDSLPKAKQSAVVTSQAPILQLQPLEASVKQGEDAVETATEGAQRPQKKKRRRRKRKKKGSEAAPLEKDEEKVGESEGEESD